jgi:carbonic anhydrase
MTTLDHLFDNNRAWASRVERTTPGFFLDLSRAQQPKYLWIGCSDSRVPANEIVDLPPGQVFVHRNIANVVVHTDLNCLSVIQFAVEVLNIEHIIVCGHYNCGGILAALQSDHLGLLDNWLRHIKDVYRYHQAEIDALDDVEARRDRLCELNVIEQVANVCHTSIVQNTWKAGHGLTVHGWIYSVTDGILRDLRVSTSNWDQLSSTHQLR